MVTLTINGQTVQVPAGTTILEAAEKAGIKIPTLCYLKDINKIAACRMCVVEVEGSDQILTLSTCSYEQENYRTVVYARRVREGESSTVDIAQAEVNPDPVMPGDN